MLPIPRPEIQTMDRSGGCDQSIPQFDLVALGVLPKVVTGYLPDDSIDGNAADRAEESAEDPLFMRTCTMPQLSHSDRGAEDSGVTTAQLAPASENRRIASPRYFDQNVRVNQDRVQDFNARSRFPLRSWRM
jgi:hypothetical protein